MTRSSRKITLVLITTGLFGLGFAVYSCDHGYGGSSTRPYGRSHSTHWWGSSRSSGGGSSSGSHSFSSHTSRGGFGSTGHSVGS